LAGWQVDEMTLNRQNDVELDLPEQKPRIRHNVFEDNLFILWLTPRQTKTNFQIFNVRKNLKFEKNVYETG